MAWRAYVHTRNKTATIIRGFNEVDAVIATLGA
jgi:hypothetical protein